MREAVAERKLSCEIAGKREEVIVRFGRPFQEDDSFICEYEISISGECKGYKIIGGDSVQALQLAMFMVGSALHHNKEASNWSSGGEPGTGLPSSLDQPIIGLSE